MELWGGEVCLLALVFPFLHCFLLVGVSSLSYVHVHMCVCSNVIAGVFIRSHTQDGASHMRLLS